MQRSSIGYRGGIRIGHHYSHNHRIENGNNDDDDINDNLSLSNSNSDDNHDLKDSLNYSSNDVNNDFESAIRNLRPSAKCQKTTKTNLNISKQKADLPQLNSINDDNHNNSLNQSKQQDEQLNRWFPKPDIGYVDSNAFIRHNHIESEQPSELTEQSTPPTLLTAMPPVGVSTRPTAIVAPAGPTRTVSAFFSSNSSIKKGNFNNNNNDNFHNNSPLKSNEQQQQQITSSKSSAFQPINSLQNIVHKQSTMKPTPVLMDIPQHKALERGQQLTKVHISHPQSPSIVHLMLHEDFDTACRLLHDMAKHPDLQIDHAPTHPFKAQVNRLCACYHEGRWFRCRILQISPDFSTATVVYLDWGMMIPMQIGPEHIRRLPNEFYAEPACSIMCHLDGVSDTDDSISSDIIAQCIGLLSENEYDVIVNGYNSTTGGKILLSFNGTIINDQVQQLLMANTLMSPEDELIEQFRHELPLTNGDELKVLLSAFSGKDDSFYVLLVNESTVVIDRAMNQFKETNVSNRYSSELPRIKTLVVARYSDDGKWYRAWIKSICLQRQQAFVFFVDFGNESTVLFSEIYPCPESVRTIPWLGIRVRLTDESMTYDELTTFWKITQSNYIWIKILEIFKDSYGIQIKIDYSILLRYERMKSVLTNRFIHKSVQTSSDEQSVTKICSTNGSEINSIIDQNQIGNENFMKNLFEMIINELRRLRNRINDSDDASQDRHSQLMQLLLSTFNLNNSNNQKKTFNLKTKQ